MKIQSIQNQNFSNSYRFKQDLKQYSNPNFEGFNVSYAAQKKLKKTGLNKKELLKKVPFLEKLAKNHDINLKIDNEGSISFGTKVILSTIGGGLAGALAGGLLFSFISSFGYLAIPLGMLITFGIINKTEIDDLDKFAIELKEIDKNPEQTINNGIYLSNDKTIITNFNWAIDNYIKNATTKFPEKYLEEMIDITNGTDKSIAHRINNNNTITLFEKLDTNGLAELKKKFILSKDDKGFYPIHEYNDNTIDYLLKNLDKDTIRELLDSRGRDGRSLVIKRLIDAEKNMHKELLNFGYTENEANRLEQEAENLYIQNLLQENKNGALSIHSMATRGLLEVHRRLKHRPDILVKLHSTKNNDGYYPMQTILNYYIQNYQHSDKIEDIEFAIKSFVNNLKEYPDLIKTVLSAPKSNGRSIFEDFSKYPQIKPAFEGIFTENDIKKINSNRILYDKQVKEKEIKDIVDKYAPKNPYQVSGFYSTNQEKIKKDLSVLPAETLFHVLTHVDNNRKSNINKYLDKLDIFEINKRFTNKPKELTKLYTDGITPILETLIENNSIVEIADFIEKISSSTASLYETKQTIENIHLKKIKNTRGLDYANKLVDKELTSKLEQICEQKYYTAEDFLEILGNKLIEETDGGILNIESPIIGGSLLMRLPDILPNEKNKKIYNEILSRLNELPNLNYDQKDMLGISFLEKIMNSENEKLFDFVKHKTFTYSPELDLVVNNISNNDFKEKVLMETKIGFPDIEEACELASYKAFKALLPQFNSPFYNRNSHGRKLFDTMYKDYTLNSINKFMTEFERYLPENAIEELLEKAPNSGSKWWT